MKTAEEIKKDIALGEDSSRQFKLKLNNESQIAQEMCAMSNSKGGIVYIGIEDKKGTIVGLESSEIAAYNQYISNAASQAVNPPVYPQTAIVEIEGKKVLMIEVPNGPTKPYCVNDGVYWVKSGSDKRKASPQELARLFADSNQFNIDELPTSASIYDIDKAKFYTFFEKEQGQEFSSSGLDLHTVFRNKKLAESEHLTLTGLLLFGSDVLRTKPYCLIRCVSMSGTDLSDDKYIDQRDCKGTLDEQFRSAMLFLSQNLKSIQSGSSFNSRPQLEVNDRAIEESVVNALLHRDYSKNAPIKLFVFADRMELISPGQLPNHLSVANIMNGNSVMRNPILCSFGTKILPYSGLGSGIGRILKNHPETEFINDTDGQQFKVIMKRRR